MKRCCPRLTAGFLLFAAFAVVSSQSNAQPQRSYVDRQVIVKLDNAALPFDVEQLRSSLKATVKQRFASIDAELWEITGMSVDEAVTRFHDDWRLDYIEPNYIVRALDVVPNDPRFSELWGLHNTGQTGGVADADIDAPEAWSMGTGGDVLVGVIDSGVDWNHVDLAANIFVNPGEVAGNGVDDDDNGYIDDIHGWDFVNNDNNPFDDNGHGTHVAGTIAAVGNNGIGVTGVSWSARILPLKFLDSGGFGSTSTAILAVQYATAMGAKLTNNSWGGGGFSAALRDAIQAAGDQGILFIAAAGNDGINNDSFPHYPSSYDLDNIISVASTDHNDARSGFSNYGVVSVDLAAPGSAILSTFPNNQYGTISGTSMATPHVSGAVCLLWSVAPLMTRQDVKQSIMTSVDPLPSLAGRVVTGGRLNVFTMLSNLDEVPPARVGNLAVQSTGSTTARLTWIATGDDGEVGTASTYDVRYSKSGIYWSNFNAATPATGEPQPKVAGSAESFEVTGLDYNTKYFFALVVEDEQGNRSTLSSLPNGTTLGAPHLAYSPGSFAVSLHTGGAETRTLTIQNTGAGTLDFASVLSPPWVSLEPPSGRVLAGQSLQAEVRFNATSLAGGSYNGILALGTNDITQPNVPLDVSLQVTDAPDVAVSPPSLDFGARFTGTCSPDTIVITNVGTTSLQVSGIGIDNSVFSADTAGFSLAPSQSRIVPVSFCPLSVATEQGTLTIASNDPDHPAFAVPLAGEGVAPPVIVVSPPSLSADLFTGGQSHQVLSISNQGGSNLDIEISLEEADGAAQRLDVFAGASVSPRVLATGRPVSDDELERMKRTFPKEMFIGAKGEIDRGKPSRKADGEAMTMEVISTDLEEVFGSPVNVFTAAPRTRGNLFACSITTALREHRFYLNPYGSTQLWFLVYEGLDQVGTYGLISASNVTPAGPGLGWYSSGEIDVVMEEGRYYLIVASFEGLSDYFNNDFVEPYPYPASFGELIAGAGWTWAPTSNFPPDPFQDVPDGAFGQPAAYYQTLVTSGAVRWLSLDPEDATVPPAATLDVAVQFDAAGLFGGDYDANIRIASNDPVNPEVVIPAHLHVTGAPDIALSTSSIDYGPQFIGAAIHDTLTVSNNGTDLLTVTGIISSHPDYSVAPAAFALPPTGQQDVVVTYSPTSTGPHPATLTVSSDDPDEPLLVVALAGEGVEPPIIGVSPQSFSEDLFTGETSSQTLNISNSGESALTYRINIQNVLSPSAQTAGLDSDAGNARTRDITPATSGRRAPASARSWTGNRAPSRAAPAPVSPPVIAAVGGLRVLLLHTDEVSTIRNQLASYSDLETVDEYYGLYSTPTLAQLEDYDAVVVINGYAFSSPDSVGNVLADYVDGGGAVIMTIASFIGGWDVQGRFAAQGYFPFTLGSGPLGAASLGTFDPAHPIMAGVTTALGDLLAATTVAPGAQWVASWDNGQPCVATQGSRVVGVNAFFAYGGYYGGDIPLILHNAVVWAAGAAWLGVEPAEGTVPPHSNVNLAVNFDAEGLFGGDYVALINIANNDPLNANVSVPAALHVTGAPDIAVTPGAIDYGPQFIGAAIVDSVTVTNAGTDLLVVSGIVSSHPDYTVDVSSFALVPLQSQRVVVTFAPTATGPISGSLTISSNDVDEGVLVVDLDGVGVSPPIASVTPESLEEDLLSGETATQMLTISNSGESPLSFDIEIEDQGGAAPSAAAEKSQAGPLTPVAPVTLAKGQDDPRSYPPMALSGGGPDAFGYSWRDNNGPGGPSFNWIDASAGTSLQLFDDNFISNISLGFTFTYYGQQFTKVGVGSNGWLSFTGADGWYPSTVPYIDYYIGPLAAFGRDLYPPGGNYVRYRTIGVAPRRQFVVEYNQVPDYGGTSSTNKTFEIILSEGTNTIRFQYLVAPNDPYGFGIESPDQTMGMGNGGVGSLFISPSVVRNSYVIEFAAGPAWLAVDTPEGVVPPHGQVNVAALFDATGVYGGDYSANIRIATNDPLRPALGVPVGLHVTGAPNIVVSPVSLGFGSVFVGGTSGLPLHVTNSGTDDLVVSSISSDQPQFTSQPNSFTVPPGGVQEVTVIFSPTAVGPLGASLSVHSNDPNQAIVTVTMSGIGLAPPVIAVTPTSLTESLVSGGMSARTITVDNVAGGSPLNWSVVAQYPGGTAAAIVAGGTPAPETVPRLEKKGRHAPSTSTPSSAEPGVALVPLWVNVAPSSGSVPPGASTPLGVTIDATGLSGGDYHADLVFTSNDPLNGNLVVPVDLHVIGVPDISVTPSFLYFAKVPVGLTVKQNLVVSNEGTDALTVSDITGTHPSFGLSVTSFVLAPGQSRNVEVSFTPPSMGSFFTQITLTSNDPDEGTVSLFAVGEGTEPPVISVSPSSINDTVAPGEIGTHTLTIGNSGLGDLEANIRVVETGGTAQGWSQHASIVATKRSGPRPSGGPDPFGYRWKDSDDPGGPVFAWATVQNGTNVALFDESFVTGIPLGFTFRYYDVEYTSIGVGSNGWLSFNGSGNGYPAFVPQVDPYAGAIAPYARNLYPPTAAYVRYQTFGVAPNRQFIIEYNNVPVVGSASAVTFEVILSESVNSIRFQYLAVTAPPIGFGIESPDQQRGMGNAGSGDLYIAASRVKNSYAIEFSPAPRWLGATPTTAVLRTNELAEIIVTLDARNLAPGDYDGKISVYSNDPLNPLVDVPVTLRVDSTAVSTGVKPIPVSFALEPNRPNPFNPTTTIAYDLADAVKVRLVIYDVAGRAVRELVNSSQSAGRREIVWDGRDDSGDAVASGVYFYRLIAGEFVQTRKMVLLK